jgi:hypothetical protein
VLGGLATQGREVDAETAEILSGETMTSEAARSVPIAVSGATQLDAAARNS